MTTTANDITYRLEQKRRVQADFPGPKSVALTERRKAVVAAGVASSVPVYVADADGGIIHDVDGNSFIDLGSGIAVTSRGRLGPRRRRRRQGSRGALHPHLLHGHALRGLRRRRRAAEPPHPGRPREAHRAVQLRRRGRGERRQGGPPGHRPRRRRRLRPRLPRPHQPHHGADRQGHAVQDQLRPVRARGLPHADELPVPRGKPGDHRRRGRQARHHR